MSKPESFMSPAERLLAEQIAHLAFVNPFLPERLECERQILGDSAAGRLDVWSARAGDDDENLNVAAITTLSEELLTKLRERLVGRSRPTKLERDLYEDVVTYVLFTRYQARFYDSITAALAGQQERIDYFDRFLTDFEFFFDFPSVKPAHTTPEHLFACFFQVRRAFHHLFTNIVGGSMAAARLRGAAWQSIFSHDMRRYRRSLFSRMGDITTLITGPTGTGKELVAHAIGLSRYIPFDARTRKFTEAFAGSVVSLNLSALSPTLIESELFGHRKGAFTGALQDRQGWLETCRPLGTVFLDEIGELDPSIQVKLLRVLQTRTFQRLGDTTTRSFRGKIIAATNRNLALEIERGSFREDFYYRLCSDLIVTPTLREQLDDQPGELRDLVDYISRRVAGEEEAASITLEVLAWVNRELGADYPWPGNFRELEQCVRNIVIRKEYRPPQFSAGKGKRKIADDMLEGRLSADELLSAYCTVVYASTGNYLAVARRLGIDRRTVKARIDQKLLEELQSGETSS